MSNNNNFSRRRRGMRFRPKGGLGPNPQKTDRDATQARAEEIFDSHQRGSWNFRRAVHRGHFVRAAGLAGEAAGLSA